MAQKIAYWSSTTIAGAALLMALSYLTGNEQVVSGFAKAGYPQHLRIVLGMAKPAAAIVLLLPGFALLKELGVRRGDVRVGHGVHLRLLKRRGHPDLEHAARPLSPSGSVVRDPACKSAVRIARSLNRPRFSVRAAAVPPTGPRAARA
jgi:DoxX-like family